MQKFNTYHLDVYFVYAPSQHVTLLSFFQNKHQLVDAVDLVLNALNERSERIRDVVNEGVRNPIRRDADIIFQLLDPPPDILWVGSRPEVELKFVRVSKIS